MFEVFGGEERGCLLSAHYYGRNTRIVARIAISVLQHERVIVACRARVYEHTRTHTNTRVHVFTHAAPIIKRVRMHTAPCIYVQQTLSHQATRNPPLSSMPFLAPPSPSRGRQLVKTRFQLPVVFPPSPESEPMRETERAAGLCQC